MNCCSFDESVTQSQGNGERTRTWALREPGNPFSHKFLTGSDAFADNQDNTSSLGGSGSFPAGTPSAGLEIEPSTLLQHDSATNYPSSLLGTPSDQQSSFFSPNPPSPPSPWWEQESSSSGLSSISSQLGPRSISNAVRHQIHLSSPSSLLPSNVSALLSVS